jgi:hypothetical protein
LGTAALAIANGATGADAIKVQNKVTVALDFTTRTAAAGLGESVPLSGSLLTASRSVLNGVDGSSLNDASVTAAMNATTTFLAGSASGQSMGLATSPAASTVITITGSDQLIDPGAGGHTIQFLYGAGADILVLHDGGVDQVSGFDATTDVLDLRALFLEANVSPDAATLTITDIGSDAVLGFDPSGLGPGSPVAVLDGLVGTVTNVAALLTNGAIRIA